MKLVFVDTSGFYAFLDRNDHFHATSSALFLAAEREGWHLITTNYVVHESWALIQARLGWEAVDDWNSHLVSLCEVIWVDQSIHAAASARAHQARERRLSLTDCASFEVMHHRNCKEVIADDAHFTRLGFKLAKAEKP